MHQTEKPVAGAEFHANGEVIDRESRIQIFGSSGNGPRPAVSPQVPDHMFTFELTTSDKLPCNSLTERRGRGFRDCLCVTRPDQFHSSVLDGIYLLQC